jgi:hypothetical protein
MANPIVLKEPGISEENRQYPDFYYVALQKPFMSPTEKSLTLLQGFSLAGLLNTAFRARNADQIEHPGIIALRDGIEGVIGGRIGEYEKAIGFRNGRWVESSFFGDGAQYVWKVIQDWDKEGIFLDGVVLTEVQDQTKTPLLTRLQNCEDLPQDRVEELIQLGILCVEEDIGGRKRLSPIWSVEYILGSYENIALCSAMSQKM